MLHSTVVALVWGHSWTTLTTVIKWEHSQTKHKLQLITGSRFSVLHHIKLTIFSVIIVRKSLKSIVPEPSLSMSAIIFLISSFFGSNPRARIATCGTETQHSWGFCGLFISVFDRNYPETNLELLHVYCASSICVKEIKSLLNFLLLLLSQFAFGTYFFPLARGGSWFAVTWRLGKANKTWWLLYIRYLVRICKYTEDVLTF